MKEEVEFKTSEKYTTSELIKLAPIFEKMLDKLRNRKIEIKIAKKKAARDFAQNVLKSGAGEVLAKNTSQSIMK